MYSGHALATSYASSSSDFDKKGAIIALIVTLSLIGFIFSSCCVLVAVELFYQRRNNQIDQIPPPPENVEVLEIV